jgi:hypothetical protein
MGIRIERHQSNSPQNKDSDQSYRPEVKTATVRRNQRNLRGPLFFRSER